MTEQKRCPKCRTRVDVSAFASGQKFRCPGCGQVLRAPRSEAVPPPLPRHPPAPVRLRRRGRHTETEADVSKHSPDGEVQARVRASKLCSTSLFVGVGAAVGYLVAGAVAAPVALVALVLGLLGFVRLARVGRGRPVALCEPGRERLASRMARAARVQGTLGIVIGGGLALVAAVTVWASARETGGRQQELDPYREHSQAMFEERSREREEFLHTIVEAELEAWLSAEVWRCVKTPTSYPSAGLPDVELARRLRVFLDDCRGSETVSRIREGADDPWRTYRRLLDEYPGELHELTEQERKALRPVIESGDPTARAAAEEALGALGG